jgi:hypothetical protein
MALLVKRRMRVTYNLLRLCLINIKDVRIIGINSSEFLYQNIAYVLEC